jgi:hypothetical protein
MRRALAVAAFALVLAVPAAWSQRGGAHGGGGGHSVGMSHGSGFSSHSVGMTATRGSVGNYHSGYHGCYNCGRTYPRHAYPYAGYYGRYGYRYPYYGYGYYWPWYWDTSSYDNDDSSNQSDASRQIDGLNQQVQQLRDQLDDSQYAQTRYGPPAPHRPPDASAHSMREQDQPKEKFSAPGLATVLVFRDQRIQEVKNYAIIGKTLVVIADERQRKIPLSDLDLDATTKLNEERGVDFQLPR